MRIVLINRTHDKGSITGNFIDYRVIHPAFADKRRYLTVSSSQIKYLA